MKERNGLHLSYTSYDNAIASILSEQWLPVDSVNVDTRKSLGLIAALTIHCGNSVPEFNRSAVGGFAIRHDLTTKASENGSAKIGKLSLTNGKTNGCVTINTGETMPDYADSVIMVEYTIRIGEEIFALEHLRPWENVSLGGENLKPESEIILKGMRIEGENLAAAIACRINSIPVHRKFLLSVISTGDEILSGRVPTTHNR
ncbi:MAG: hypothetical protein QW292_11505 [Candidatus Parvarchaeota archaeon]